MRNKLSQQRAATPRPEGARQINLVSHDLRSALVDVIGGLSLVDMTKLTPDNILQIERAKAAGDSLAELLNLAIEQSDQEISNNSLQADADPNWMDLAGFIQSTTHRWRGRAIEQNATFKSFSAENLPEFVNLNRNSLDRIVSNIIENAIKFSAAGRIEFHVTLGPGDQLKLEVLDDGPGFKDEALQRLFTLGGRPSSAEKKGTGFGLFICKSLVDAMQGELHVTNRQPNGASVCVSYAAEIWSKSSEGSLDGQGTATASLSNLHILLVEDNATNQLVASQMLQSLGAQVTVASDGLEALERLNAKKFDLALLDIEMPRMSGLELIKAIRSRRDEIAGIPLIALTAYVLKDHRDRIYAAGADGIIAKPLMNIESFGNDVLELAGLNGHSGVGSAKSETADSNDALINRSVYNNLTDLVGHDGLDSFLTQVLADLVDIQHGLTKVASQDNMKTIRSKTHVLISLAGAIGAVSLKDAARDLNTVANREDFTHIQQQTAACLRKLELVIEFVRNEKNTILDPMT